MTERPIIFSAEMIRAILAGTKTQTRRVVKPQPDERSKYPVTEMWFKDIQCRYGKVGDRLWVREKFSISGNGYFYSDESDGTVKVAWSSPIHMPRKASRITLEIAGIRVEHLQDIKKKDVYAEGIIIRDHKTSDMPDGVLAVDGCAYLSWLCAWIAGWNRLNAKRGFSWESNPWIRVIEFK